MKSNWEDNKPPGGPGKSSRGQAVPNGRRSPRPYGATSNNTKPQELPTNPPAGTSSTLSRKADPTSLLSLLKSPSYCDMKLTVGTGPLAKQYHLHQNIICTRSNWFLFACNNLRRAGKPMELIIPDILPPIFDVIIEWIYGEVLVLRSHQPLILALFKAADQIHLTPFKVQVARQVAKLLKDRRRHGEKISFNPFEIVRGMFDYYHDNEWTALRKCTDELALADNIPLLMIHDEKRSTGVGSAGNTKFWFALALSYQKALESTVCMICRDNVSAKLKEDRMCCHCDDSSVSSEGKAKDAAEEAKKKGKAAAPRAETPKRSQTPKRARTPDRYEAPEPGRNDGDDVFGRKEDPFQNPDDQDPFDHGYNKPSWD